MKITSFLLLITCLQVSANANSQQISLAEENSSLQKVFKQIERQTGYSFLYSYDILQKAGRVNVNVRKVSLSKALDECLKGKPLEYTIVDRTVVIRPIRSTASFINTQSAVPEIPVVDVRGKVVDDKGNPVEGVNVQVKGGTKGTTTNSEGEFFLEDIDERAVLVLTSVNIETREIAVNGRNNLGTITTQARVSDLEDVVVNTGYQNISRERATGSYNVINREQLEKPATNIGSRLIGTTAGMQADLDVDGNPSFEIRGQTTLYGIGSPLIVVDGFPIQGEFSTVNPNDVESVTVLKDAAAASIWGARAANGVIVVVTRNAKRGTPLKVEFNTFTRMGRKFDLDYVRPLASSAETVEYEKMAFGKWSAQINSGAFASNYGKQWSHATVALSEYELGFITASERDQRLEQLKSQDNRSQILDHLLQNPVNQQYNLNLFSSSERMTNAISLMYEDNKSNFRETNNKRYMVNYRNSLNIFKWLDFDLSGMFQYVDAKNSGVGLGDIQGMSPYEMLVNSDGSLTNIHRYYWPIMERFVPMDRFPYSDWTYNPISEIRNRDLTSVQLNTRLQAGLTFKVLDGLTFNSRLQYEQFNTTNRGHYNDQTHYVRDMVNRAASWDQSTNAVTLNLPKGGILTQNRSKASSYNFRNQVNFNRNFADRHAVNFVGGSEINNVTTENFNHPTAYGYNDQTLTVGNFPNGPGGTFFPIRNWLGSNQTFAYTNSFAYRTERYFSVFGNLAYTYDNKYTLSGSYRTDASNLITDDPKYRFDPFWSVGLGWQIYREDFMSGINWVDRLNLRATYGYNGNVDRSTAFMPLISTNPTPNVYTNNYTATISSYGNPTLRWEKTGTINIGLDYSLFRGKLFGKVDVYNKSGKDLIAQLSIPAVNGTTSQKLNNAAMTNRGIEIELGTTLPLAGNRVTWRSSMNLSYNKNTITELFIANYAASTLYGDGTASYVEGEDANSTWRFIYDGLTNNQPMVKGPRGTQFDFGAFTPGDGREYMINTGTRVAPYTFGFINSFHLYNFNLSFIVTGKFGHVFQRTGFNYPPTWTGRVLPNNKLSEVMNGDPANIVPLPLNEVEPRYYFWDRFHQNLSYLIESASHLRMQEINLNYNVPQQLLSRFNVSRLNLYAQGNDLFTIISNDAGEDPEYALGTMNPRPKLTLGFRLEF